MVDTLQAVDTSGIEPMANPLDATQRLRADVVSEENQRERFQAIAPASENGLYLVPKVIE
jgi:aspartyl-tRNA(Asn)/glutamyl-tRNA(Gln) amidotransferase subunit C